jgi:CRP/FNR family transcriptional regulator
MSYRPVLADEPYSATAEAIRPATICSIPSETFLALIDASADLSRRFLAKFGVELRISEEQTLAVSQQPVRQRVARLLLFLLKKCPSGGPSDELLGCELTRMDMAQMVGTTPETFSRTLRNLAADNVIEVDRVTIRIRSTGALSRIAGKSPS